MGRSKTVRVAAPQTPAGAIDPRYEGSNTFRLVYTNKSGQKIREVKTFRKDESPKTYIESQGLDFKKVSVQPVR